LDQHWFGLRIRQARERKGLSQDEFAAAVAKDQRAISEYENGKRKLAATDLPLFATILEVPLLYFFEPEASADDLDAALLNYFHRLPTEDAQRAAVDILRIFSNTLESL
jgi:transcriptional regulator with XRE-family HTH domain